MSDPRSTARSTARSTTDEPARRRRRIARWAAVIGVMSIHCTQVNRPTTLTVGGDLQYGEARSVSRGCEGEVTSTRRDRQISGGTHARYEHESGFLAGGHLRVLHDTITDARPNDSNVGRTGWLHSLGAWTGFDGNGIGGDLGLSALGYEGEDWKLHPYLAVRAGDLDRIWVDGALGSRDPLFDGQLAAIGFGYRNDDVRARAGLAAQARWMPRQNAEEGKGLYLGHDDQDADPAGYLDFAWQPGPGLGITAGAMLSVAYAVRVGLTWQFDAP